MSHKVEGNEHVSEERMIQINEKLEGMRTNHTENKKTSEQIVEGIYQGHIKRAIAKADLEILAMEDLIEAQVKDCQKHNKCHINLALPLSGDDMNSKEVEDNIALILGMLKKRGFVFDTISIEASGKRYFLRGVATKTAAEPEKYLYNDENLMLRLHQTVKNHFNPEKKVDEPTKSR